MMSNDRSWWADSTIGRCEEGLNGGECHSPAKRFTYTIQTIFMMAVPTHQISDNRRRGKIDHRSYDHMKTHVFPGQA